MTRRMKVVGFCLAFGFVLGGVAAQQLPVKNSDLASMNIEDLMNIEVTSVSKTDQKIARAAAAVFVITQEDIRRSGATNIPDLLRMAPGLDVAQINGSTWAISARGFNEQASDELLVLIDGRTVYSPLFSGVYWDAQSVPLENIDRIEVIRGPGASVWGVNAVNGVISIVTKKADQTLGGLLAAGGGTNEQGFGTVRYGGKLGDGGAYRVSANYSNYSDLSDLSGKSGEDSWDVLHADIRVDKQLAAKDSLTVEGNGYRGDEGERVPLVTSILPPVNQVLDLRQEISGWSILSKWDHIYSPRSDTSLQVYFDRADRHDPTYGDGVNTIDIDFQHHFEWGARQNIVWGLGYRHVSDATQGTLRVSFTPADQTNQIFSTFFQDEIAIRPDRLFLTLGVKLEHNKFTGLATQPTARIAWMATRRSTIWSSFSIAEQTPSLADVGVRFTQFATPGPGGLPVLATVFGNPKESNEDLFATELGYRQELESRLSFDLTAFFNHYNDLRSTETMTPFLESTPSPPHLVAPFVFANLQYGETHGAEAAISWQVSNRWTLTPGYAFLAMHFHHEPTAGNSQTGNGIEGDSPTHQAQLRSHMVLPWRFEFDTSAYFVERLPAQDVPSYTRLDSGFTWHAGEQLSISIAGQNLLQDHHLETSSVDQIVLSSLIRRSGYVKLIWWFN